MTNDDLKFLRDTMEKLSSHLKVALENGDIAFVELATDIKDAFRLLSRDVRETREESTKEMNRLAEASKKLIDSIKINSALQPKEDEEVFN